MFIEYHHHYHTENMIIAWDTDGHFFMVIGAFRSSHSPRSFTSFLPPSQPALPRAASRAIQSRPPLPGRQNHDGRGNLVRSLAFLSAYHSLCPLRLTFCGLLPYSNWRVRSIFQNLPISMFNRANRNGKEWWGEEGRLMFG